MNTVRAFVARLIKDQSAAGMVEYALLVALIGVLLIVTLIALACGINDSMGTATTALGGTVPAAPATNPFLGPDPLPGNQGNSICS